MCFLSCLCIEPLRCRGGSMACSLFLSTCPGGQLLYLKPIWLLWRGGWSFCFFCLNEMLKSILAGDGPPQRYLITFPVLSSALGMHLEPLSQGKGTGCLWPLHRLVWVMRVQWQNVHRKTREWGEMVFLTSLISQKDEVYNFFFFFSFWKG